MPGALDSNIGARTSSTQQDKSSASMNAGEAIRATIARQNGASFQRDERTGIISSVSHR
jgi:hypothetical protein